MYKLLNMADFYSNEELEKEQGKKAQIELVKRQDLRIKELEEEEKKEFFKGDL